MGRKYQQTIRHCDSVTVNMSLVYFESCYYSFVELAFREEYNCTGLKQNFRLDRFDLLKAASRNITQPVQC